MKNVLVIGYGNPLRSDDGAGRRAAELIGERFPHVESLSIHELHPELAEIASGKRLVVFLDAATGTDTLQLRPITPAGTGAVPLTHAIGPEQLLALCKNLYDTSPEAYILKIPAYDMTMGESFSAKTHAAIEGCVGQVGRLLFEERPRNGSTGRTAPPSDRDR
jgi:hydrogenase maturation protease